MELEELMTNRLLLEKMSDENMHLSSYRKHPKQVIIQEHTSNNHSISSIMHHSKPPPKDVRIEYSNSKTNKNGYRGQHQNNEQKSILLEGYGCHCSNKFMKKLKLLWVIIILIYLIAMPLMLYYLYDKLSNTRSRLKTLEIKFEKHFQEQNEIKSMKQTSNNNQEKDSSYLSNKLIEAYYKELERFKSTTHEEMNEMEKRMDLYEKKLNVISLNNGANKTKNCACENVITKKEVQKLIQERCQCNSSGDASPTNQSIAKKGSTENEDANDNATPRAVYTHWGKSSCREDGNTSTIYNGYIASSYHTHEGGGTNYLCLPTNPKYNKYDALRNVANRGYIHGVEFQLGDSNIFDTDVTNGQYFDALCSVCEVENQFNSIMIPGTITCPAGWNREYFGYIMAQNKHLKRTQYICVDHQPDLTIGTERWGKGGFLHFVETGCGVLPCRKGLYERDYEITCVVCSN